MAGVPRTTVDDSYTSGLSCAICGRPDLYVQHLPNYPDFVTCRSCSAAFVVEDTGERVMYGTIPAGFPGTTEFALRQWVWLEAVDRRAAEERAPAETAPAETALRSTIPEEPAEVAEEVSAEEVEPAEAGPSPDWLAARLSTSGMPAGVPIPTEPEPYRPLSQGVPLAADTGPTEDSLPAWLRASAAPAVPSPAPAARPAASPQSPPAAPVAAAVPAAAAARTEAEGEPVPHQRHRVVVRGDRVRMPVATCAHCQKSPAPDRLPVPGSLPRAGSANRRNTTFQVPLCSDCSRRAKSRSTEQTGSRVMALLTGALVGLVLVVIVLATGLVPFAASLGLGLLMLGVIWFIGFGLTAGILLGRTGRMPSTPDAAFVRSTLKVVPDASGPQTGFEWRNPQTAVAFFEANAPAAVAAPSAVDEPADSV
jgi:hypothetical protein